ASSRCKSRQERKGGSSGGAEGILIAGMETDGRRGRWHKPRDDGQWQSPGRSQGGVKRSKRQCWCERGIPEGKVEPAAAIGVEERSVEEDPQVRGRGGVTTVQGGAGGMREPGGVERLRVFGGAKSGMSQGIAD
ncbi:hypothetical protein F2P79_010052, partial [Pimephales promelas]